MFGGSLYYHFSVHSDAQAEQLMFAFSFIVAILVIGIIVWDFRRKYVFLRDRAYAHTDQVSSGHHSQRPSVELTTNFWGDLSLKVFDPTEGSNGV
jgi:hypothetical protein